MAICSCCDTDPQEPKAAYKQSHERSCTDLLFLLLFIGGWGAVIGIISAAGEAGAEPARVYRGVDWQGNICGKGVTKDYLYGAFPDPLYPKIEVCVKSCTYTSDTSQTGVAYTPYTSGNILSGYVLTYKSIEFLNWCYPDPADAASQADDLKNSAFSSAGTQASRVMNDLYTAWVMILISAFVALLFSFWYLIFLKYCASNLVVFFIAVLVAGGILTGVGLLKKAQDIDNTNVQTDRAKVLRAFGWFFVIITFVFVCVVIFLWSRIKLAIEVVKQAGAALRDLPGLVIMPLFPFLFAVAYVVFWIVTVVFIFSVNKATIKSDMPTNIYKSFYASGQTTVDNYNYTVYEFDEGFKKSLAYVFFHLLWQIEFLIYFTFLVVAGACANWYFTPWTDGNQNSKVRGEPTPENPRVLSDSAVAASVWRTIRYHLGTVAFAALIIAIIDFIRAVVKYIERQSKPKNGEPNRLQKALFCCIQCCLSCIRCCCDKINKAALIWCSIWGTALVPSICSSFKFIWANLARTAALNMVSAYLLFIGKVMVAAATTGIALLVFYKNDYYKNNLNSPIMPCILVFLLSYGIATLFMTLYECCIDTIFLCFLVDEDEKKKNGSYVMCAHTDLQKLVGLYEKESAETAKQIQSDTNEGTKAPN